MNGLSQRIGTAAADTTGGEMTATSIDSELTSGAPRTVLVVDDDAIIRDVVVRYLERDGYADPAGRRRRGGRAT